MKEAGVASRISKLIKLQSIEKIKVFKFSSLKSFLFSLAVRLAIMFALAYVLNFVLTYANTYAGLSIDKNILAFFLLVFSSITFLSSLFNSINSLFNAKDSQFLMHLPVTPSDVFASKVLILLFQEIISGILLIAPLLIGFGMAASSAFFGLNNITINGYYIVGSIFISILLPVASSLLAVLLSLPMMLLINYIKKRRILVIISLLAILALFILIFNLVVSAIIGSLNFFNQFVLLTHNISVFIHKVTSRSWAFLAIASSFTSAKIFLTVLTTLSLSAAVFLPIYFIVKPSYLRLSISGSEKSKRQTKSKAKKVRAANNKKSSSFFSIVKNNILALANQTSDIFQYFVVLIVMPFLILLINRLLGMMEIRNIEANLIIASNILMLSMFTLISNTYAATAVSREGSNFYLVKVSPINYLRQSYAKLLINFLISVIFVLITCFVIYFVTSLSFLTCSLMFLTISVLNAGHICLSYERDLKHPHTEWFDEAEIKKNKNISYSLLTGFLIALIFGGFAFKFMIIATYAKTFIYLSIMATAFTVYRIIALNSKIKYYLAKM